MSTERYAVEAVLTAKDKGMSSAFDRMSDKMSTIGKTLAKGIGFGAMMKIGSTAISTVTNGLKGFATEAISAGTSFESTMSKVGAVSGASADDMERLTAKAKEMGATTKFSASEAGEAMNYMAMAGWDAEKMLGGIEGVMNLAAASGEDLATTSDIVTDAMTAFGIEVDSAGKNTTHFADVLAAASSNANTNVSMLGESFKYVAPVAGALGYQAEDVAVALGLMANAGIKGSQSGTALRSTLTRMAKPTDEVATAMSDLGIAVTDSSGKMKPLKTLMGDLRTAFSSLDEAQSAQYATMLAGQEGMSGLLAIVNASTADYDKLTGAIENCDGVAKSMADTMGDNLQGKMTILGSSMEGLGIAAYDHLKKPFSNAVDAITDKVGDLTKSMTHGGLGKAMDGIGNTVEKGVDLGIKAFDKFGDVVGDVSDVIVDHGEEIISIMGGIGSAVAAIKIGNKFSLMSKGIQSTVKPLGAMKGLMKDGFSATDALLSVVEHSPSAFKGLAKGALDAGGGLKGVMSVISGMISPTTLLIGAIAGVTGGLVAWGIANRDLFQTGKEAKKIVKEMGDAYEDLSGTLEKNKEYRQQEIEDTMAQSMEAEILAGKVLELADQEGKSASQKQYLASMVEQLNELMPDLNLLYDAEADKLSASADVIWDKVEAMKAEAEIAGWKAAQESVTQDLATATREQGKAVRELGELETMEAQAKSDYQKAYLEWAEAGDNATQEQITAMTKAKAEMEATSKAVADAKGTVAEYDAEIGKLNDEFTDYGVAQQQISAKANWDNLVQEAKDAEIQIPKAVKDGIEAGQMMVPDSIDQLKSLITWNDLVAQAENDGVAIPTKLAMGIKNGSIDPAEAVAEMTRLMDPEMERAKTNAENTGRDIPEYLAEGLQSGQVTAQEAINAYNAMIAFDAAATKAEQAGYEIPQWLAQGMNDGSISVLDATHHMNELANFDDLIAKADEAGVRIPTGLAEQVKANSIELDDACNLLMMNASTVLSQTDFAALFGADMATKYYTGIEGGAGQTGLAANQLKTIATDGLQPDGSAAKAGAATTQEYSSTLAKNAGPMTTSALSLGTAVGTAMDGSKASARSGQETSTAYDKGLDSQKGAIGNTSLMLRNTATDNLDGGASLAHGHGYNLGLGLALGMEQALPRVKAAADALVEQADRATRAKGEINSPSKLFKKLGAYIGEGFALGIESTAGDVMRAAEEMVGIPSVSGMSAGSMTIGTLGRSSGNVTINFHQEMNGREVAKGTATFMRAELDRLDRLDIQLKGG